MPLEKFAEKMAKGSKYYQNYSAQKDSIETRFGTTYIIYQKYNLNNKNQISQSMIFKYGEDYYSYIYYATPAFFNQYIKDYASIFDSLTFKK